MHFNIENEGSGTRYVVTLTGHVAIAPGKKNSKRVDMDPDVARQYLALSSRGKGTTLKVTGIDDESRAALQQPLSPRKRNQLPPGYKKPDLIIQQSQTDLPFESAASPYESDEAETKKPFTAKAELLSRADEMELTVLREEAKMLLGANWPKAAGNKLSKRAIKALLAE